MPALPDAGAMLARIDLLIAAARELAIPITVTEQYPAGLGRTVAKIGMPRVDEGGVGNAGELPSEIRSRFSGSQGSPQAGMHAR